MEHKQQKQYCSGTAQKKIFFFFFKPNANWRKTVFWNIPGFTIFAVYKYIYDSVPGHLISRGIGLSCGELGVANNCW